MQSIQSFFSVGLAAFLLCLIMIVVPAMATAPVAGFTESVSSGSAPLTVQFTDTSTNTPTLWSWDFGESTPGIIYEADYGSGNIYAVYPNQTVVTVGSGFNHPEGVGRDQSGNIYVATLGTNYESFDGGIYEITPAGTVITLDSPANDPEYGGDFTAIAVDAQGYVYGLDEADRAVEKINPSDDSFTTIQGAFGSTAYYPNDLALDAQGNLYVADSQAAQYPGSAGLMEFDQSGNLINSWAGFTSPTGVTLDAQGNIYVADGDWGSSPVDYSVTEIFTNGTKKSLGAGLWSSSNSPWGISVSPHGDLYVSTQSSNKVTAFYANGTTASLGSGFNTPSQIEYYSPYTNIQNPDYTYTTPGTYSVSLIASNADGIDEAVMPNAVTVSNSAAGSPIAAFAANATSGMPPMAVQFTDKSGNSPTAWSWNFGDNAPGAIYVADMGANTVNEIKPDGSQVSIGSGWDAPSGVALDPLGNVYVANAGYNNGDPGVYEIKTDGSKVSIGSGFSFPACVAVDSQSNVYVGDIWNPGVYEIKTDGTQVSIPSPSSDPNGIAVDSQGNVYVADPGGAVFETKTDGTQLTIGSGWDEPYGVAVDSQGNIYVADSGFQYNDPGVYKIKTDGTKVPLGSGWSTPAALVVDPQGNAYVADYGAPGVYEVKTDGTKVPVSSGWSLPVGVAWYLPGTNLQNPDHTYTTTGTYTVSLTTANALGTNTLTIPGYISIIGQPNPSFTTNLTAGAAPLTVQFTDSSTGAPTSWLWDFGDGTTSTVQSPVHIYPSVGIYSVNLTESNTYGSRSVVRSSYIGVYNPPVAAFSANVTAGLFPLTVQFMDNSTGVPTSWLWDFGDGTTSTLQNPSHTYTLAGNYSVNLTVTNPAGSNSLVQTNYITAAAPFTAADRFKNPGFETGDLSNWTSSNAGVESGLVYDGSYAAQLDVSPYDFHSGYIAQSVDLTNVTSISFSMDEPNSHGFIYSAQPLTVSIDGISTQSFSAPNDYMGWQRYTLPVSGYTGVHLVQFTFYPTIDHGYIDDVDAEPGGTSSYVPVPAFTANVTSGIAPVAVQFNDTTAQFLPNAWSWSFGDGATSTLQNPVHTYTTAGNYTVNLTATNAVGNGTTSMPGFIKVTALQTPVAAFTANTTTAVVPFAVQFTDLSTGGNATSWSWNFGDGATSNVENPVHTYSTVGTYTVNLTSTNNAGSNTSTKTAYIQAISPTTPVASFTANNTAGPTPFAVQFTDQSTGSITAWLWNFGDGATSTLQNPVHTYSTIGTYSVNLTASNAGGGTTATMPGYITVAAPPTSPPVASFVGYSRDGLGPLTVRFKDTSTNYPTSWAWNFGDGSSTNATMKNPVHTYSSVGTYTVTLMATNGIGSNSSSQAGFVQVVTQQALTTYRGINLFVANDPGVKYDVPNGVVASNGEGETYSYVPNTYFVNFRQNNGGTNPIHISSQGNTWTNADFNTTTAQSGSFWVDFSGGQPSMPDAIMMVAVNGTIPDDFKLHIRSTGQDFDVGTPSTNNQGLPAASTYLNGAVDESFGKSDFIYGPQSWKPDSFSGAQIYNNENQSDPTNQFNIMFIDLRVGALQNASLPDNGMVNVQYSFTNLTSTAVFNVYGWYEQCNHGTGIVMSNDVTTSGFTVTGTPPVPQAPVASFTSNVTTGATPLAVSFQDTSSNAPTSWLWDFGDGDTSTSQNPVYTYSDSGTYTVKLTATNSHGSNTMTKSEYITATQPLTTNNNIFVTVSNLVGVKYNAFNNNTYNINFNGANAGLNALHISTDPTVTSGQVTVTGNQSGTIYATDTGGKGYEDDVILMVAVNGTVPDNFGLTVNSDGYTWTPNPASNTPPTSETYQPSGLSESFTKSDFRYGPQTWKPTGSPNYPIYSGQDMTNTTNTFQIMFIDLNSGVLHQNGALQNQGAVRINYSFQNLTTDAALNVYAWCQNSNAGNNIIGWTNDVSTSGYFVTGNPAATGSAPVAAFTASATSGSTTTPIQFTDSSANSPTSWSWDFGDSTTSTTENPSHTYTTAGTYTVKLTATNGQGSNTVTRTAYITITAAGSTVASFTATPLTGNAPLAVQFTDTSTNNPTSWHWDFGDATNSTLRNPSHTYTAAGTYSVNLTATNGVNSNSHLASGLITVGTVGGVLPGSSGIYVRAANSEGVKYNTNGNDTYYINPLGAGGGLSAIHISTDPSVSAGQVTVSGNQSGTFYLTDTSGNGGYQDDAILMLAVNGTLPNNFAVHVRTGGYTWTPSATAPGSGSYTYQPTALDETFSGSQFLYGPQNWKPTGGSANYPVIYGENMNSSASQYRLMFIDTRSGVLGTNYVDYASLTNNGAVRVDYSFTNLPGCAAFNVYAWKNASSNGQGMGWTNALTGASSNGFAVLGTYTGTTTSPAGGSGGYSGSSGIGDNSDNGPDSGSGSGSGGTSTLTSTVAGANPGQTVSVPFNQVLGDGMPLGIDNVQIVTAEALGSTQVILHDANSADILTVPDSPVAGIEQIEFVGTNPSAIDHGTITFSLTGSWLRDHNLTPADIVMLREHDSAWNELPTTFDHQDGDTYYFTATTPGFSYFAVAGRGPSKITPTPATTSVQSSPTMISTPDVTAGVPAAEATTSIPAAIQTAIPTKGVNSLIPTAVTIVAVVLIVVAAAGSVVWWRRRRDPLRWDRK